MGKIANRAGGPGGIWNVSIVTRPPLVSIVRARSLRTARSVARTRHATARGFSSYPAGRPWAVGDTSYLANPARDLLSRRAARPSGAGCYEFGPSERRIPRGSSGSRQPRSVPCGFRGLTQPAPTRSCRVPDPAQSRRAPQPGRRASQRTRSSAAPAPAGR